MLTSRRYQDENSTYATTGKTTGKHLPDQENPSTCVKAGGKSALKSSKKAGLGVAGQHGSLSSAVPRKALGDITNATPVAIISLQVVHLHEPMKF